jgi:anti-sigma B factor antagonist
MDMGTSPLRSGDGDRQHGRVRQPCTDFAAPRASTLSWYSGNDLAVLTDPRLTTHHHADYSVVALRGEFDVASRDALSGELHAAASSCPGGTLVIDLAAVEFMDCTVLGVLVEGHRKASLLGLRLVMVSPPIAVQRLLDITHIDRIVPTQPHLRAALSAPAATPHQDSSERRLA